MDRSDFIATSSDTIIQLKGKAEKFKLQTGDNHIQVIGADGVGSNVFTLKL